MSIPEAGQGDSVEGLPVSTTERIADLERRLAETDEIVKAFRRLEDLARERRQTPEAVAVQVTIDVLEEEARDLGHDVDRLTDHPEAVTLHLLNDGNIERGNQLGQDRGVLHHNPHLLI